MVFMYLNELGRDSGQSLVRQRVKAMYEPYFKLGIRLSKSPTVVQEKSIPVFPCSVIPIPVPCTRCVNGLLVASGEAMS